MNTATSFPLPSGSTPAIELDHLSVRLGSREILHDLTARVDGRAIGLLGPNGAGKSTLIRTLLGFHAPSQGTARVLGGDVRGRPPELRRMIGYMPENDAFVADMSAVSLVRLMGELSGLPSGAALERAHAVLLFLGAGEERYRPVGTFSVGMKQLTKLAAAAVSGPPLLILDEPTNGLDAAARRRMIDVLLQIRNSDHTRLLMSSHLLHDIEACCDVVVILKDGRLVEHSNLDRERRTNRKFLHLELIGEHAAFLAEARTRGCEISGEGADGSGGLRMVLPEDMEILEVYAMAREHAVRIGRLGMKRDSLADIFMTAMDGGAG